MSFSVGRLIAGTGTAQDLNLNGDYYILYGMRSSDPAAGRLGSHLGTAPNPAISAVQFNPTTGSYTASCLPYRRQG